jgi:hypothetical protein
LSSGYKKFIADKGLTDETYKADSVALIQISGTSIHNNKAVQVDAVCSHWFFLYYKSIKFSKIKSFLSKV